MIEECFDIPFVARLALKEKQIQQNCRPYIAVHKWFARRPGTLFRALALAEFLGKPVWTTFYESHRLTGRKIADPFMGGGTPVLEANRLGCDVEGYDINPMAWWVVSEEIKHIDLKAYRAAGENLVAQLRESVGELYTTRCVVDRAREAPVKTFLWVKTCACEKCGHSNDLFPGRLLAENVRHPRNVVVCRSCGELTEVEDLKMAKACHACDHPLSTDGSTIRGRFSCERCGHSQRVPQNKETPLAHRLFALEYHNPRCAKAHQGRFFKKPDAEDLAKAVEAEKRLRQLVTRFVPDDTIPSGDESDRLHRWGYSRWRELFHPRQLLGLELSARILTAETDERIRNALCTNFSDLLRYQNSLCRYDTMALKVLDIFSVHGFPVGLVSAEANLLGIIGDNGAPVGSGGWANILTKYGKAKAFCDSPFEIRYEGKRKHFVPSDEWIGEERTEVRPAESRAVKLVCGDSSSAQMQPNSLDAVFTDPPYFGNVQYSELMDFCYVWLRKLVGDRTSYFKPPSTRHHDEVVGNDTAGRGIGVFAERLGAVWTAMAAGLKSGAPLAFTFHHNDAEAYAAIAVAILDAGLVCSASLPCPAEMGGSVHIHGTGSSIIDTVFVCRRSGRTKQRWLASDLPTLIELVRFELNALADAEVRPTQGDARCVMLGHLTRLAVWSLRHQWNRTVPTAERLSKVEQWFAAFGQWEAAVRGFELAGKRSNEAMELFIQETGSQDEAYATF